MVDGFIKAIADEAKWYATNHLIVTMGSDFNYIQAHMFFKELDKLISYVNARQAKGSKVNLLYSTPSCYLKELNNDNRTWTTKDDDFFPYADRPHTFWTGYFTSRPALKRYARQVNNFFQIVKQMAAVALLDNTGDSGEMIQHLAETLAVAQHHDAITGTEKQAVTYDYAQRLAEGVNSGQKVLNTAYLRAMYKSGSTPPMQTYCPLVNISICNITSVSKSFQVTIYNPLTRPVEYIARVPVQKGYFTVFKEDAITPVPSELRPISKYTANIPDPQPRLGQQELVFPVSLPGLGFVTYFVVPQSGSPLKFEKEPQPDQITGNDETEIAGKYYSANFDSNGNLISITNRTSGTTVSISQNFFYYQGFNGNCSTANLQASGAYIFRPSSDTPEKLPLKYFSGATKGNVVAEVTQQFSDWVSQVVRVYEDKPYIEVEWTVGPIPIEDHIGKEVVTRYNIENWDNNGIFYTDSNGREVLQRKLNYRPTWKLNQTEQIAGNYYPVNAFMGIKDGGSTMQFTVLTDRSQGGISYNNGDLELMLHRRLLADDAKGVGEALNEQGSDGKGLIVRGKHYLILDRADEAARQYRPLAQEIFLEPQMSFTNLTINKQQYWKEFYSNRSGLLKPLPSNVHLLTLERFRHYGPVVSPPGTVPYLIRFEHFYEVGEDTKLSEPVTFDMQIFASFKISDVHELSLGANTPIEDVHRLSWKTVGSDTATPSVKPKRLQGTTVTLNPMEIITLQADVLFN